MVRGKVTATAMAMDAAKDTSPSAIRPMPSNDQSDVAHPLRNGEVVLQLGPVCIETAARQAWRRVVERLTTRQERASILEAALLREFIEATDFSRMRCEHQELAGGLRCQVRLRWAPDGQVHWELCPLCSTNGPQ